MEGSLGVLFGSAGALVIMSIVAVFMSSPFRRAAYLKQKIMREIVAHDKLGDGLKDEARFMLEEHKGYDILGTDWIKHNEGQFSGELLAMAKETVELGRVCEVRRWIFISMFLITMGAVAFAAIGAAAFTVQGIHLFTSATGEGWLFGTKYRVLSHCLGISIYVLVYLIWHRKYSDTSLGRKRHEESYAGLFLVIMGFILTIRLSEYFVNNLDGYISVLVSWIH